MLELIQPSEGRGHTFESCRVRQFFPRTQIADRYTGTPVAVASALFR